MEVSRAGHAGEGGKRSPPRVLTSGPASTSSFFASSQKVSGTKRRSQRRFFLQLLGVRSCWPAAIASLKPFSSGRFACFMLPLCYGIETTPLPLRSVKTTSLG